MATIQGVHGEQFVNGLGNWTDNKYQYAMSTYEQEHHMDPALVVKAADKEDIARVLAYAKEQNIAVAVRTGGHQYSGASSTKSPNIQLNLMNTFRGPDDRRITNVDGKYYAYTSVSWHLGEFNKWLGDNHLFVPHGQCVNVALGGHIQTGGYGQLGRSFGLLGDHVVSLEIINYKGEVKEITKESDPDMFFAFLGGSPGNLGILTHVWLEVYHDDDYPSAHGMKALFCFKTSTLKNLLDILVEMSDDEEFPRNYDLCVSALSSNFPLPDLWPGLDEDIKETQPDVYGKDGFPIWPRSIVVYAQWVPFSQQDVYDDQVKRWFERISSAGDKFIPATIMSKPMSKLTAEWIFRNIREFPLPYSKRTYLTKSRTLGKDDWVDWVVHRVNKVVEPILNGQFLSAQFQCFGGKYSKFTTNAGNGTAYSWRDSTLCATIDNFHWKEKKDEAEAWQHQNDVEGIGPNGIFSKEDRRVLWGSYGSFDLDSVWQCYHEDEAKYKKLRTIRQKADPDGIFTPNTFAVKRAVGGIAEAIKILV